jgi:hypothetical protein
VDLNGETFRGRNLRINVAEGGLFIIYKGKNREGGKRYEDSKANQDTDWRAGSRSF